MTKNLKLGDRLAIIKNGVAKGLTPQQAIAQYKINEDGGYNAWKNQFRQTTGVNPDLDDTYNYELFFKENPDAARLLLLGKVSPEILKMYKTPQAIQREKQALRQGRGSFNDLMDYSRYEKLINDYMNKSVSPLLLASGGPINSVNIYAEGTNNINNKDELNPKDVKSTLTNFHKDRSYRWTGTAPAEIVISREDLNLKRFKTLTIEPSLMFHLPEAFQGLPDDVMFVRIPKEYLDEYYPGRAKKIHDSTTYYIYRSELDNLLDGEPIPLHSVGTNDAVKEAFIYTYENPEVFNSYLPNQYINENPDAEYTSVMPEVIVGRNGAITKEDDAKILAKSAEPTVLNPLKPQIEKVTPVLQQELPQDILGSPITTPNDTNGSSLINVLGSLNGTPTGLGKPQSEQEEPFYIDMPQQDIDWSAFFDATPYPITGINWPETELEYLNPPGYVDIPNWNVDLISDDGDGPTFKLFMMSLAGYRDNTLRDVLMAKLFEPKDYFADPYAGLRYTNTQQTNDPYNNDPYTKIQRESNGIPLYANGGRVNLFKEAGPVIKPTWNQFQQQYLDYFTQQNEEFLKQLEDVREYNSLYGKNQYYDWKDFGGYEPKYVLTLPSGLKVYDAPGTKLKQFYPEVDFPRPQYFVIPNKYGQYSYIPQDGYVSQAISYYRGEKPSGELEGADELRRLLNQITVQQSDNTSLYNTAAPTLTKPTTFSSTLSDNRYEGASIGPDNRTAYEREIARNRGELELWNLTVRQPREELEGKVASTFSILDPLKHLGAAARKARGEEGSYLDNLFSPENHGVLSVLGDLGESFGEQYPLLDFGLNMITYPTIMKGIGRGLNTISKYRSSLPINENYYYRQGKGIIKDAMDSGVIRTGVNPLTGRQEFIHPYFNKGRLHYGNGHEYEVIVNKGKGNYHWEGLNGADKIVPGGKSTVSAYNGKGSMVVDFGFRTPLVKGQPNLASAVDFDFYEPINVNIFGKEYNLGYWKNRNHITTPSNSTIFNNVVYDPENQAFRYNPTTGGYDYTGIKMPDMLSQNLEYTLTPRGFSVGPVLERGPQTTETIIKNVANHAKEQILLYLESDELVLRIMKSGVPEREAITIANEMYANAADTKGPIIEDFKVEGRQGSYNPNIGTVDMLYNNGPIQSIENVINNSDWTFRPEYKISPYAEDYYQAIYHELGGHGATMGYNPKVALDLNKVYNGLGDKYLEIMKDWYPHHQKVYEHNLELKPIRKPEFESSMIDTELEKKLKYLEDPDEYGARARAALIDKGYKLGWDYITDDFKMLLKYFTKESLKKLLDNSWQITLPVTVGYGVSKAL